MNINFEEYNSLTLSEKVCYGKIETLSSNILTMTLDDLEQHCQVSTATINRTLKKLGYKNLKEYKHSLQLVENSEVITSFDEKLVNLIQTTPPLFSEDILDADKIYVIAFGITSSLANEFMLHLREIGIRCDAITDSDMLNFIQLNNKEKYLILYLSYSGADLDMQKNAVKFKGKVKQILVTCTSNSILSYSCDRVICTNTSRLDKSLNSRIPLYIIVTKQLEKLEDPAL